MGYRIKDFEDSMRHLGTQPSFRLETIQYLNFRHTKGTSVMVTKRSVVDHATQRGFPMDEAIRYFDEMVSEGIVAGNEMEGYRVTTKHHKSDDESPSCQSIHSFHSCQAEHPVQLEHPSQPMGTETIIEGRTAPAKAVAAQQVEKEDLRSRVNTRPPSFEQRVQQVVNECLSSHKATWREESSTEIKAYLETRWKDEPRNVLNEACRDILRRRENNVDTAK
jgi:pentatricopeptide repeat protein